MPSRLDPRCLLLVLATLCGCDGRDATRNEGVARGRASVARAYDARITDRGALRFRPAGTSTGAIIVESDARTVGRVSDVRRTPGETVITRERCVERFVERPEGVEQTWTFSTRPATDDLEVDVSVRGVEPRGADEQGLHFASEADAGLLYGHATWIDARGHRTPVLASFDRGRVRLHVARATLDTSAYPAVLDPLITPEVAVDAPVRGVAQGRQAWQSVACLEGMCVTVWEDARREHFDVRPRATRITQDGQVLDPTGYEIAPKGERPMITAGSSGFLVVYAASGNVMARTLDRDGLPFGEVLFVADTLPFGHQYDVASNGTHYLVTWVTDASYDVLATRISESGERDVAAFAVTDPLAASGSPAVTSDGTDFVVAWLEGLAVKAARVSANAEVLDPGGVVIHTGTYGQNRVDVATVDGRYVFAFATYAPGGVTELHAVRYATTDPDLGVTSSSGPLRTLRSGFPVLASRGEEALLVFDTWSSVTSPREYALTANRIDGDGTRVGANIALAARDAHEFVLAAAWNGTHYVVLHSTGEYYGDSDVYMDRIDALGAIVDGESTRVTHGANAQRTPSIAGDGRSYLVAWMDERADRGVRTAPIDAAGTRARESISVFPLGQSPQLEWTGSAYALVSNVAGRARVVHLDRDGALITSSETDLGESYTEAPDMACDAASCIVVWQGRASGMVGSVFARIANMRRGDTSNVFIPEPDGPFDCRNARVGTSGAMFFVVRTCETLSEGLVLGHRIDASGALVDTTPIHLASYDASNVNVRGMATVWDGRAFVTAYTYCLDGTCGTLVVRTSAEGLVLDAQPITIASVAWHNLLRNPAIVAVADGVLVAYVDAYGETPGVFSRHVSFDGLPSASSFEVLGADTPAFANGPDDFVRGAYARYDDSTSVEATRVFTRGYGTLRLIGEACTDDSSCASGRCVDSVCCDECLVSDDAGTDGEADAGTVRPVAPSGGCGCSAPRRSARPNAALVFVATVGLAWARRRRHA